MRKKTLALFAAALFSVCSLGRADFKYTQSGQVTGAMTGAQVAQATVTTTSVKGPWLRIDLPDGSYGIIDLNGRRDIQVDPRNRTYSVITFDAVRADDEAYEQQVRRWGFEPRGNVGNKLPPSLKWTGNTQVFLGQTTRELALRLVIHGPAGRDPSQGHTFEIQSWVAGAVPGFAEVRDFYAKLTGMMSWAPVPAGTREGFIELTWVPVGLSMAMRSRNAERAVWVPLMTKGMVDLYGTIDGANGLPMLISYRSSTAPQQNQGVGGGQEAQHAGGGTASRRSPASGSTVELNVSAESYSTETLDPSLFRVPPGYTLSQRSPDTWITSIGRNGVLLPFGM